MFENVQLFMMDENLQTEKYSITEREALSVIVAIQKCRPYLLGNRLTVAVDHHTLKWLMSLTASNWKTSPVGLDVAGMTLLLNTVKRMHYHDTSTPFPSKLYYHKLRKRNCLMLRTAMTRSNPSSNIWKIGLYQRTHRQLRKLCNKKASISSVTMTFYKDNHMQGKESLFNR